MSILILEDQMTFAVAMRLAITHYYPHEALWVDSNIETARDWMNHQPDGSVQVIIVDRNLEQFWGRTQDGMTAIEPFAHHSARNHDGQIILWTSHNDDAIIDESQQIGAQHSYRRRG